MKCSLCYYLLLVFLVASCKKEQSIPAAGEDATLSAYKSGGFVENNMVLFWNEKITTVLSLPMIQPARARYQAIMAIAVHDAINTVKPKYRRYATTAQHVPQASPDAAVAAAAYWVIKGLNRQGSFPIDAWYSQSLATIPEGTAKEQGKAIGQAAAAAIIALRANDGFSQVLSTSTNPPNGTLPGAYRQTNANNVRFIPNWGTVVQPFVMTSSAALRPAGPYAVTSAEYTTDYNEVKAKGARTGSTRTQAEQTLALFWSENKPSILWNQVARQAIASKKLDAWKTARLFAILYTSMADGITADLEAKYHYYYWRPETAIREGAADGNPGTTADPSWISNIIEVVNANPLGQFVSPPVPEYPSGYAMYGGAAERALQLFLGGDAVDIDLNSATAPGVTLHYTSLAQAAEDNAISRIYAGWYFRKAVHDGADLGRAVAQYVWDHHFTPEP